MVKDNGRGISEQDALVICKRNVTSKIHSLADLSLLTTLGFRGEALNSIASLSSAFYILTRPEICDIGIKYKFNASTQLVEMVERLPLDVPACLCNLQKGTTIIAEGLFHGLPVRLLEMKKAIPRDMNQLARLLEAYLIARPSLGISCSHSALGTKKS